MNEHQRRMRRMRLMSDSLKRRANLYSSISSLDRKDSAKSLTALRKAPDPGGKLQKIGFIVFWIPEPTGISNAVAAPMILTGRYLQKRYNGATIKDIGEETKNHKHTISSFKDAVL